MKKHRNINENIYNENMIYFSRCEEKLRHKYNKIRKSNEEKNIKKTNIKKKKEKKNDVRIL